MDPARRKAIDRVRKLIAVGERDTTPPHEAAAVHRQAQRLIDRYDLTECEIADHPAPDDAPHDPHAYTGEPGDGMRRLFYVISNIIRG